MPELKDRIIVALDVSTLEEAKILVESLSEYVSCFKIGLQLLTSVGAPKVVEFIHDYGGKVFLDGKFHDIPNTMGKAAKAAANLNVKYFDLHTLSGEEAIKAAVANKGDSEVLAVTILTSLNEAYCQKAFKKSVAEVVFILASTAAAAGVDGIICSPKDLKPLKYCGRKDIKFITPGIRPEWAQKDDQARFMTPGEAIKAGAYALVIGRPITQPPKDIGNPVDAVKLILEEIQEALAEMGE